MAALNTGDTSGEIARNVRDSSAAAASVGRELNHVTGESRATNAAA